MRKLLEKCFLKFILKDKTVPLVYNDGFFTADFWPASADSYTVSPEIVSNIPTVGIVIQGGILHKNDFTLETVKIYKKIFGGPNVKIILSTWADEDTQYIDKFKELGMEIILSNKPDSEGLSNINYQIKSSLKGIEYAKKIGCEYVMKTRSDQRIYAPNSIGFMFDLMRQFPLKDNIKNQNKRIMALSFNTFKYRFYGVTDMFLFGEINDMLNYWNVPYRDGQDAAKEDLVENHLYHSPETYLTTQYVRKIGYEPKFTLDDSLKVFSDYFCIVNEEELLFYWSKYTNCINRFASLEQAFLEKLMFKDWLNLYINDGKINWSMPDFSSSGHEKLNLFYFLKFPGKALKRIINKEAFKIL